MMKNKLKKFIKLSREYWKTGDEKYLKERIELYKNEYINGYNKWHVYAGLADGFIRLDLTDNDIITMFVCAGVKLC